MNTSNPFVGMFSGFDFMRQAASGVAVPPGLGSWIPTLDPKELDSRINELKTVLFWLEQNAAIVKSTMQALEVQKMTLGTLGAMNVGMAEMARAFTMPPPDSAKSGAAPVGSWPFASPVGGAAPQAKGEGAAAGGTEASAPQPTLAASMAAPAQMWWNALAAQFQQLAGNVEQQQAAVEAAEEAAKARTAATAKAAAEVAEAAAEVAEAAAEVAEAAAAVQAKPRKRAARAVGEKGEKEGKEEEKEESKAEKD